MKDFFKVLLGVRNPGTYTASHAYGQRKGRQAAKRKGLSASQSKHAGGSVRLFLGLRNPGAYAAGHAVGRKWAQQRDQQGKFR
jgi:hypothetical protein